MAGKRPRESDTPRKGEALAVPEEARNLPYNLQVSETRYRRLFETAQDGILLLDAKTGEITDVNPFLIALLGYPRAEIVGKKLWEIGPFVDREAAKQAFEKLQEDRYIRYEDLPLETATGARIHVEFVSNVYPVDGKQVIQCNIRDITRRKTAENLARQEAFQKDYALTAGELGAWKLDLSTGTAWRSPRHDEIFGYPTPLPEWTYEMFLDHVLAEDRAAVDKSYGNALAAKIDWDFTCRIRRADGEVRWIWAKGKPEFNEQHEPVALFGLVQDITGRKRAEEELRESELKYRQVVENAAEAIFVAQDARLVFINPSTSATFGRSGEELLARPFVDFIHPDDRNMVLERHKARSRGEEPPSVYAFRIVREDGATRWVEVKAVRVVWHGAPATLNLLGDITERRRAESERERLLKERLGMSRLALALGETLELGQIYQRVYDHVSGMVDAEEFIISSYDAETELIRAEFVISEGTRIDTSGFPLIPLEEEGHGTQSRVIRTGEPLYFPDFREAMRQTRTNYTFDERGSVVEGPPPRGAEATSTNSALLVPLNVAGKTVGVLQLQSNQRDAYTPEAKTLLCSLANVAAVAIQNAQLYEKIGKALDTTIRTLGLMTEMRDPYTAGHQQRVADLACALARAMNIEEELIRGIRTAGLTHDIGKLSVPAEILSKPFALTPIEFGLVKTHPQTGSDILKGITFPWPVAEMVLQHHERLDGSGYPRGLKADTIMVEARILTVADVVEAMSSHRPYRPALGIGAALDEIRDGRCTRYDGQVVDACVALFESGEFSFS